MYPWLLGDKGKWHENKKGLSGLKYTCAGKIYLCWEEYMYEPAVYDTVQVSMYIILKFSLALSTSVLHCYVNGDFLHSNVTEQQFYGKTLARYIHK